MHYNELLLKRRSVRLYLNQEVPKGVLFDIIKESTCAPSSGNEQPWKFIVVSDKSLMHRISDEAKKNLLTRIASNPNDSVKKYEKMLSIENFNIFYNAPCLVYIVGEKHFKNVKVNCSLAASYFMMSAAARGLGTCWVNFALAAQSQETLNELGFPENCEMVAPIIIGYPEKIPAMPKRKDPVILRDI